MALVLSSFTKSPQVIEWQTYWMLRDWLCLNLSRGSRNFQVCLVVLYELKWYSTLVKQDTLPSGGSDGDQTIGGVSAEVYPTNLLQ